MRSQRLATCAACLFTAVALTAILRAQERGSGADEQAISHHDGCHDGRVH
jgi:hypothetical protein